LFLLTHETRQLTYQTIWADPTAACIKDLRTMGGPRIFHFKFGNFPHESHEFIKCGVDHGIHLPSRILHTFC